MSLEFDEKEHQYYLDEKPLISVTQLMQKHGLAPTYAGVSQFVLNRKADFGTAIHKEIELFIKENEIGFSEELINFVEYINKNKINIVESEYRVHNDIVAGTIDLVLMKDYSPIIADIKTTSLLHYESVSWQLSIYLYLMLEDRTTHDKWAKYEQFKGQCYHFQKDHSLRVVDIPLKPQKEVAKLIESERNNTKYQLDLLNSDLVEKANELQNYLILLENQRKNVMEEMEALKHQLVHEMELNGLKSFSNDKLLITYIAEQTRTSIDTEELKKHPRVYKKCIKEIKVKPNVRITIKERK